MAKLLGEKGEVISNYEKGIIELVDSENTVLVERGTSKLISACITGGCMIAAAYISRKEK